MSAKKSRSIKCHYVKSMTREALNCRHYDCVYCMCMYLLFCLWKLDCQCECARDFDFTLDVVISWAWLPPPPCYMFEWSYRPKSSSIPCCHHPCHLMMYLIIASLFFVRSSSCNCLSNFNNNKLKYLRSSFRSHSNCVFQWSTGEKETKCSKTTT